MERDPSKGYLERFRESPFSNNDNNRALKRERRWNRIKRKQKYNTFRKTKPNKLQAFWNSRGCVPAFPRFRVSGLKVHFLLSGSRAHRWCRGGNCPAACGAGAAAMAELWALSVPGTQCRAASFPFSSLLVCSAPVQIKALRCCWFGTAFSSEVNTLPPVLSC